MTDSDTSETTDPLGEPAASESGDASGLPLFYAEPRPLTAGRHGKLGIADGANYGFAGKCNAIPLNAQEFVQASRDYPVVFAEAPPHLPMAICGLRDDVNLFVDAAGDWAADVYVPAYVRRFPFIFLERPDVEELVLCVEEGAGVLSETTERPLFDADGTASAFTDRAVEFCRTFHQQHRATRRFAEALAERGLLRENTTELQLPEGRSLNIKGFRTVDPQAFDALPDDVFLDWRRRGWLAPIYPHLASVGNWASLVRRAARRQAEG